MSSTGKAKKIRVGVLFGGQSGEHEVSLTSAKGIMGAMDRQKYDIVPIGITKSGQWLTGGNIHQQLVDAAAGHPVLEDLEKQTDTSAENTLALSISETGPLDVVFRCCTAPLAKMALCKVSWNWQMYPT